LGEHWLCKPGVAGSIPVASILDPGYYPGMKTHSPEMYGAVGDDVGDDWHAFDAMMKAATHGDELRIPHKRYRLSKTWVVDKEVSIVGSGAIMSSGHGLLFDANTRGLELRRQNVNLRGVLINARDVPASMAVNRAAHGLFAPWKFVWEACRVSGFPGNGVHIESPLRDIDLDGDGLISGSEVIRENANGWRMSGGIVSGSGLNGIYVRGADSNYGRGEMVQVEGSGRSGNGWGVFDDSFLGNIWDGMMFHANAGDFWMLEKNYMVQALDGVLDIAGAVVPTNTILSVIEAKAPYVYPYSTYKPEQQTITCKTITGNPIDSKLIVFNGHEFGKMIAARALDPPISPHNQGGHFLLTGCGNNQRSVCSPAYLEEDGRGECYGRSFYQGMGRCTGNGAIVLLVGNGLEITGQINAVGPKSGPLGRELPPVEGMVGSSAQHTAFEWGEKGKERFALSRVPDGTGRFMWHHSTRSSMPFLGSTGPGSREGPGWLQLPWIYYRGFDSGQMLREEWGAPTPPPTQDLVRAWTTGDVWHVRRPVPGGPSSYRLVRIAADGKLTWAVQTRLEPLPPTS
jgi:hypothetical protein